MVVPKPPVVPVRRMGEDDDAIVACDWIEKDEILLSRDYWLFVRGNDTM